MITKITCTAIMTALAVVLMYLEIPLPFMPPFLKFDFSEVPVLIGSFALGPIYGVVIELLKNLIHLPATGTMGIGEASNFLTGSIYVFTAGSIYKKIKTRKGAVISMLVATLALAVIACPLNFFVTLPLYGKVLNFPTEAIVAMSNAVNPLITTKTKSRPFTFPFTVPFTKTRSAEMLALTTAPSSTTKSLSAEMLPFTFPLIIKGLVKCIFPVNEMSLAIIVLKSESS